MSQSSERAGADPQLLEWLLERAPFGVAWFSEDGEVELNREAARISGVDARRIPVREWLEQVQLIDGRGTPINELERRPAFLALEGTPVPRSRMQVHRPDGTTVDVVVEAFPFVASAGEAPRTAIVLVEDVSWASDAERVQSQWLGALAHELNGVIQHLMSATTAAQMFLHRDLVKVTHYLETLERQSRLMGRLVRDFVDAARLRGGGFDCREDRFSISSVLREAAEAAETTDSRHRVLIEADEELWVCADMDRVKQILTNLLSNAAKYSNPGLLVLGALERDDQVLLFLRDEGPGIPREEQAGLFERYTRLPSNQDGSGLGLWIARELARRMGGEVWLQSDASNPTTFFVSLPRADAQERGVSEQASNT